MQYFIRQCQGSCYHGACESPLSETLHTMSRPTHSFSAICTSQAEFNTERVFNKYTMEAVHQVDRALPVLSMKKKKKFMIHDSQLCINSSRRLVPSKGQPVWRWGGWMVGRSGDKTSVRNTRPREGTMGDIEATGHGAHTATAMYVHTYTHVLIHTVTHILFIFYKSLPIAKGNNSM